jgi:glycosyltransferase involved in cell wall biosynthesis
MDNIQEKLKALFWRIDYYGANTAGGAVSMHQGMLSGLKHHGVDVHFASGGRNYFQDIPYYYIPFSKIYKNLPEVLALPYNKKAAKEVIKLIEEFKFDFIFQHLHDFNYSSSIVKRKTGIPTLIHVDSIELWVKKNWGKLYFDKLLKWAEEIQWNYCDAILTVSNVVKEDLIRFGVDEKKIFINPNGVNPEIFHPEISGQRIREKYNLDKKFVIGFTGSFGQWHGVEVLAKAADRVIKAIPNAKILFVGDGMLRPMIENIIKEKKIEKDCIITGMVPHIEIPEYLAACDVLVSPTLNNADGSEFFGSPTKLFEYMAMGKPIVCSSVGQLKVVIKENYNGYLFEEKNEEELVSKLELIYRNPELAQNLAKNARKDAIEIYDWKHNAKRILNAYKWVKTQ